MPYLAEGPRVALRRIGLADYEELAVLNRESAELHAPWMPGPPLLAYEDFAAYMERFEQPLHEGFLICLREDGRIVGRVNVNDIVRGSRQTGTLGYAAYASTIGRGYMTEGLGLLLRYAFQEMGLNRLEANIQPGNTPSINLVKRLGFEREGYSPRFQFVNGEWRDHERWAITAEKLRSPHLF